jgi:hypothetical protein
VASAIAAKQDHSVNLDSWSALATSAKQDHSTNLDGWSALATSAKQDHSVNLDSWSALATSSKVDANGAISGATKTKITFDAKGLVTSGADATTADIADSLDKRYVTDAQLAEIGVASAINPNLQVL